MNSRKAQIRKNPRLRKALVNAIKTGAYRKLKEVSPSDNLLLNYINELLSEWESEFLDDYEKLAPQMKDYFNERKRQEGISYFPPKSPAEMFDKFIFEICDRKNLHRSLERSDFITFSDILKSELNNIQANRKLRSLETSWPKYQSAKERIDRVREIQRTNNCEVQEALDIFHKEIGGEVIYTSTDSFHSAEYNLKKRNSK